MVSFTEICDLRDMAARADSAVTGRAREWLFTARWKLGVAAEFAVQGKAHRASQWLEMALKDVRAAQFMRSVIR